MMVKEYHKTSINKHRSNLCTDVEISIFRKIILMIFQLNL